MAGHLGDQGKTDLDSWDYLIALIWPGDYCLKQDLWNGEIFGMDVQTFHLLLQQKTIA
jgi:hypothetical protein